MELKRKHLERKIIEAADGELNKSEINQLEKELQAFPDLLQDYNEFINQPDITGIYGSVQDSNLFKDQIQAITHKIEDLKKQSQTFEDITVAWFRSYALAASISVLAITSLYSVFTMPENDLENEIMMSEMFYPYVESEADEYVTYLEEISIQ